jgi:starch-binding outer membrane protein SusE/F
MKLRLLFFIFLTSFFFKSNAQDITSIGIIGDGSPLGNWDVDVDMTKDTGDLWFIKGIELKGGPIKFRANDKWDLSWGEKTFPWGIATSKDGANLPGVVGKYNVTFNSKTGEYFFDYQSSAIGIIGDAMPIFGWNRDIDMYPDATSTSKFSIKLLLKKGDVKFRVNNDWPGSWGGFDFPSGKLNQEPNNNIKISNAGEYIITIDTATKDYKFELAGYKTIGIIGDGTTLGWNAADTSMIRDGVDPNQWSLYFTLIDGPVKFRADDKWDNNWGGKDFPKGVAIFNSGDNIPAKAGRYLIEFNSKTLDYNFTLVKSYAVVGIIGTSTAGGVDNVTPMAKVAGTEGEYFLRTKLKAGFLQFRTDDDYWGGGSLPSSKSEIDGADIAIEAADYKITFNSITGAYTFEKVLEYEKISLVGKSGPTGGWPKSEDLTFANDTYLVKDPADANHWTLASATITDFIKDDKDGSGVKFRAESAWATNWGAVDFPSGKGTKNGPNIECKAGTYKIDFRSDTGDYGFAASSATYNILSEAVINVYPNPTTKFINIDIKEKELQGATSVLMYDNSGKVVYRNNFSTSDNLKIDASSLNSGNYFIQLTNGKYLVNKKVSVIK